MKSFFISIKILVFSLTVQLLFSGVALAETARVCWNACDAAGTGNLTCNIGSPQDNRTYTTATACNVGRRDEAAKDKCMELNPTATSCTATVTGPTPTVYHVFCQGPSQSAEICATIQFTCACVFPEPDPDPDQDPKPGNGGTGTTGTGTYTTGGGFSAEDVVDIIEEVISNNNY